MATEWDQPTVDAVAEWFLVVGRRLGIFPPDPRARFVEPRVSDRAETTEAVVHNSYSWNDRVMEIE
jgi:hypothetical protein